MFGSIYRWILNLLSRRSGSDSSGSHSPSYPSPPSLSDSESSTKLRSVTNVRWGNDSKITPQLRDSTAWTCLQLMPSRDLSEFMSEVLSCMAFETAYSFSPSVRNPHSGATGLIQFMPSTARSLGTTVDALEKMTQAEQMNYVYRYFLPYKNRLSNLGDVYLAIFYPAAMNKPDDWVIARKGTKVYSQNEVFDKTNKGFITRGDTLAAVRDAYRRGSSPNLLYTGTVKPN